MTINHTKKLAAFLLVAGIISIVLSGVFIFQGFSKSNMIVDAMRTEKVTYGGADGEIDGVIDTPTEAATMAGILREHRMENYGYYSELERDDPGRESIITAMTMENSLNLAQMGYGLAQVVQATGLFMGLMGLTLVAGSAFVYRIKP
jgi:hypothetical protein